MMIKFARYNIYLCAGAMLLLACGCKLFHRRTEAEREVATIQLHLERDPDGFNDTTAVSIYRSVPMEISVTTEPFLDSRDLESASVEDEPGGLFSIRLKFNWEGTSILDSATSSNPGRRIAVYGDFKEKRWLASPVIRQRISDGVFSFTPDATREEAERIDAGP